MTSPADLVQHAIARYPDGQRFLSPLLTCFPEAHWGAVPLPPAFAGWAATHMHELQADPATSPVDQQVQLDCCLETDTFVLALEDATVAAGRLFAVAVVAPPGFVEPRRAAIPEGLPQIGREEAEDLYAAYWGWCTPDQLAEALDGA